MKLTKQFLNVLGNLQTINKGLVVKSGNVIKSKPPIAPMPLVEVQFASIQFPRDFAIYDISKLLSAISLIDDPQVRFEQDRLVVFNENKNAGFLYASEKTLVAPNYDKAIKIPSVDISFTLPEAEIKNLNKAATIFGAPELSIRKRDGKLVVSTYSTQNPNSDQFETVVEADQIPDGDNFNIIVNSSYLTLMPRQYKVNVSFKGLIQFTSSDDHDTICYSITASEKSKLNA